MKVFLLNPPYLKNFLRSARCTWLPISGSNWYPIFLAYCTGWLEKHGHKTKLVDAPVAGLSPEEVYKLTKEFQPNLLVLYISQESLKNDLTIGKKIKKLTSCQIVLVGPWCATEPEKILSQNPEIDAIVRREFDDVVLDLAKNKPKKQIKGLVFRKGKKIVSNPEREFLTPKQLNQFPFVTKIYKEHLPIRKYFQASLLHPFVDLFTARGCAWNQCTFCLWPHTIHKGALYRQRKIEGVIKELKFVKKELPYVKEVFFQDDMLPTLRARQLSEAILKAKLKLNWSCYTKADIDYKTLALMKKSGCRYLHVGYESADPKILKNIRKGADPKIMKKFTQDAKKVGLRIHGDFILGLPGETEETIKNTISWAKKLGIEGYQFFIPQPHQSTPLHQWLKKKGYLSQGDISYPHLKRKTLSSWRFRAMREIYLTPGYIFRTIKNINSPAEFYRLARTASYVIPNILFPEKFF